VSRTTDEFEAQLKERPILKLNYQDIFLIGSKFSISYNSKKTERQRNHLFVSWNVETSGNSASLIAAWTSTNQQTPNISGVPISQYFKSDVELKLTRDFTTKMAWVSRFNIGFVKAYGQSEVAPFTKQFFIGGPSTLRGFEYRSVGPSRYKSIGENATLNPIDQAGDLRILINTEYRFPLFSFFRGAYFFDFGNVWLLQEDETRPDINLDWRKFYKEFAFNSGLGLRIDTDYVALRLDLGVPIYSPFEEEGNRWIYEQNLGRLFPWIRQNVVASLGIGYPF
jgi:outer membrane protein assembly factor BamA